jgi:hypothetical protein
MLFLVWTGLRGTILDISAHLIHLGSSIFGSVSLQLPPVARLHASIYTVIAKCLDEVLVVYEYPDVFPDDLPGMALDRAIEFKIELQPGTTHIYKWPYPRAPKELAKLKTQLQELLGKGYIWPRYSPSGCPALFVDKKDKTHRLSTDYQPHNVVTMKNKYPLPRIDLLFIQLIGAQVFSKIDLRSGYHQIKIWKEDPEDRFLHSIQSIWVSCDVIRVDQCPAHLMYLMNSVFMAKLDRFVVVFIDDILVFSNCKKEHEEHLCIVVQWLRDHLLYAKYNKCEFWLSEVPFLGHVIYSEGISVDPGKVREVLDWEQPRTVLQVHSFLGLAGYYRRFIPNFSKIAKPIIDLLEKEEKYV